MNDNKKAKRAKTISIVLSIVIAGYVLIYAVSTLWTLGYASSRYQIFIGSGGLHAIAYSEVFYDSLVKAGVARDGWSFYRSDPLPWFVQWPSYHEMHDKDDRSRFLSIPFWIPLLPLLFFAGVLIYRDRTRRIPGVCRKCGYDIRDLTSGRCPECGTPVPEWLAANPKIG